MFESPDLNRVQGLGRVTQTDYNIFSGNIIDLDVTRYSCYL